MYIIIVFLVLFVFSCNKYDERIVPVSVRTSSKRRLILVSPFEKESEAKLTRSTDLEEFYCITRANKNIFGYYNNSKIGQIGGGDENITIIQSPRTEGINHLEISRKECIANFLIFFFY